jgi:cell division transport system permease protein
MANVKKEKLLSMSNVFVMTVTFLVLGLFIGLVILSQTSLRYLEQQAQITIFFKDDFTEANILTFKSTTEKDPRVAQVTYVSKQDALKIYKELNKDQPILLENISSDFLPASLEVRAKNIADLSTLSNEYKKVDGVEDVRFFGNVVEKFRVVSDTIYIIGFSLVLLFLLISYSVIVATLRTTINSKGPELEIMKLVGATDSYVKTPLIYQGVFYGVVSSTISAIIMLLLGVWLSKWGLFSQGLAFGFIPGVYVNPIIAAAVFAFILILSGFLLGYFGSSVAIKKYLKY